MKKIKEYMKHIKEEVDGACEYAEKYIIYKATRPQWSQFYNEMATQELNHASHLKTMGQEFINNLSYVSEDDKEAWEKRIAKYAEKSAAVKVMLTK